MRNLDLAQLTALMENVKEAAGNIQLECMHEAANMDNVREHVLELLGQIGQLWQIKSVGPLSQCGNLGLIDIESNPLAELIHSILNSSNRSVINKVDILQ